MLSSLRLALYQVQGHQAGNIATPNRKPCSYAHQLNVFIEQIYCKTEFYREFRP